MTPQSPASESGPTSGSTFPFGHELPPGESAAPAKGTIRVLQLYPRDMNIYGDWGNALVLAQRLRWPLHAASAAAAPPRRTTAPC